MQKQIDQPKYNYKAKCLRVIDGDTIVCEWIDLGFHISLIDEVQLRFRRIDAPEINTKDKEEKKRGLASKEWLVGKIEGREIIIETYKARQHDAFHRYLAEVWFEGINLNDESVKQKHAHYQEY